MPIRLTSALLLSLALTTSACSSSMKTPDIKQNPHPTNRYEMIVTVHDAPGPFDKVGAGALYQVHNPGCVPHAPLTGGADVPNTVRKFPLTRVDDHTWHGYFYLDLLQDEDYFKLGVCHWEVMSVGADFYVHREAFSPAAVLWDVPKQQSETHYFQKHDYSNTKVDDTVKTTHYPDGEVEVFGGNALEWRATDKEVVQDPDAYFSITVSIKRAN